MKDKQEIFSVPPKLQNEALISSDDYQRLYLESIKNPDTFWAKQAKNFLSWHKPWQNVSDYDFHQARISWFKGGELNVAYNCIDRHLEKNAEKTAIIWEGNESHEIRQLNFQELHELVCKFANTLIEFGVEKGDRVAIYLPMIPEAAAAMLACARIGAVHSVIFAGFSAKSLADRINDAGAKILITANQGLRGSKKIELKSIVDEALESCPAVQHVLLIKRTAATVAMVKGRDHWLEPLLESANSVHECEFFDAEHPLFTLYTSGSTGKPKGLLHTSGGYLLYAAITQKYVFNCSDSDRFFCTADVGWITGHSYVVYGPLCNGFTTMMFESVPVYPTPARFWEIIDRHKISIFYTAPTAIRTLAKEDLAWVEKSKLDSLKVIGTVGEPINPAAWIWYYENIGKNRCALVDTWWQTETGGIMISPLAAITNTKPGSATRPFLGIEPGLFDDEGREILEQEALGKLCIKNSWPGQARTIYGDQQRFKETYFTAYPGNYFTGDGASRDSDGYYWITGRVDDVLNISGHRIGTAEVESALVASGAIAEAAVVAMPHDVKGQAICAFCIPKSSENLSAARVVAIESVIDQIGPIARPEKIIFVNNLPKTRSGKIMRRILRKIAAGELDTLGDLTTLAEPEAIQTIIDNFLNS